MKTLLDLLIGLIAVEHLWFLCLEMFLWRKPIGLKTFHMSREKAEATAVLAANQGLYNGFLAAGLVWGLALGSQAPAEAVKFFFLSCAALAGIFGAFSVNKRIFFIQGLPALLASALLCWAKL